MKITANQSEIVRDHFDAVASTLFAMRRAPDPAGLEAYVDRNFRAHGVTISSRVEGPTYLRYDIAKAILEKYASAEYGIFDAKEGGAAKVEYDGSYFLAFHLEYLHELCHFLYADGYERMAMNYGLGTDSITNRYADEWRGDFDALVVDSGTLYMTHPGKRREEIEKHVVALNLFHGALFGLEVGRLIERYNFALDKVPMSSYAAPGACPHVLEFLKETMPVLAGRGLIPEEFLTFVLRS